MQAYAEGQGESLNAFIILAVITAIMIDNLKQKG